MSVSSISKRRQAVLDSITIDEFRMLVDRFGLMGNAEAAEAIGTAQPNLLRRVGLPEPVAVTKASRIWIGEEIREWAARQSRRAA